MRIWIVSAGEMLPIDEGDARPMRAGLLSESLSSMGHSVSWWTSNFDHYRKRPRRRAPITVSYGTDISIHLIPALGYSRNVSPQRLVNHFQLGRRFSKMAKAASYEPDVILASLPIVDMAAAAVSFASSRGIPVIVDIRDLHPDALVDLVPRPVRPVARSLLCPMTRQVSTALKAANGICAISRDFLNWGLNLAARPAEAGDAVFPLGYPKMRMPEASVASARDDGINLGVDPSKKIVWFIGHMSRVIDLDGAIEAARLLRNRGDEQVQFVFSGEGEKLANWKTAAADLDNIVFTGWAGPPMIEWMLRVAWVGLAAYDNEFHAVGNKVAEYMSAGLPVLVSGKGDASRSIKNYECGLTYPASDGATLAKHIGRLLNDVTTYERMSENSLRSFDADLAAGKVYDAMARYVVSHHTSKGR